MHLKDAVIGNPGGLALRLQSVHEVGRPEEVEEGLDLAHMSGV